MPSSVEKDPMSRVKAKKKKALRKSHIKRTGLTHAKCRNCGTLPIENFQIRNTVEKRCKPGYTHYPEPYCKKCVKDNRKTPSKRSYRNNDPRVRKWCSDSAKRARDMLTDSYIRKRLKALGYKDKEITRPLIKKKRDEIKAKRQSAANRTYEKRKQENYYGKKATRELYDGYIRGLIKNSRSYGGEPITQEMIDKKKLEVLTCRSGDRYWNRARSSEEKKELQKARHKKRREDLTDVYVKGRIKKLEWYKGGEITQKMIDFHRQNILKGRKRRESGLTGLTAAERLTDTYVKRIIAVVEGIPLHTITLKQIEKKRKELREKRERLSVTRAEKEKKREERANKRLLRDIKAGKQKIRLWRKKVSTKEAREAAEQKKKEEKEQKKARKASQRKIKRILGKIEKREQPAPYIFATSLGVY